MVKKLIDNFRNHYGLAGGTEESFKKFFFTGQSGENNRNKIDAVFLFGFPAFGAFTLKLTYDSSAVTL